MPKNPYSTGKRTPGGKANAVDEDALARRYIRSNLSIAQCSRMFGISPGRARDILRSHGIEPRGTKKDLDPDEVLRAYDQWNNITSVSLLLNVDPVRVTRILDEAGVKHGLDRVIPPPSVSRRR